ncbi:MAG: hypothetical protein ACMUEL_07100 [Flavobacteriales bacterium Tduv]
MVSLIFGSGFGDMEAHHLYIFGVYCGQSGMISNELRGYPENWNK